MTKEQMINHIDDVCAGLIHKFETKDAEYGADDANTLETLEGIAGVVGLSAGKVAMILATKHWVSMLEHGGEYTPEQLREKCDDIHLYLEFAYLKYTDDN